MIRNTVFSEDTGVKPDPEDVRAVSNAATCIGRLVKNGFLGVQNEEELLSLGDEKNVRARATTIIKEGEYGELIEASGRFADNFSRNKILTVHELFRAAALLFALRQTRDEKEVRRETEMKTFIDKDKKGDIAGTGLGRWWQDFGRTGENRVAEAYTTQRDLINRLEDELTTLDGRIDAIEDAIYEKAHHLLHKGGGRQKYKELIHEFANEYGLNEIKVERFLGARLRANELTHNAEILATNAKVVLRKGQVVNVGRVRNIQFRDYTEGLLHDQAREIMADAAQLGSTAAKLGDQTKKAATAHSIIFPVPPSLEVNPRVSIKGVKVGDVEKTVKDSADVVDAGTGSDEAKTVASFAYAIVEGAGVDYSDGSKVFHRGLRAKELGLLTELVGEAKKAMMLDIPLPVERPLAGYMSEQEHGRRLIALHA
jgi:hypothetical protein